MKFCPNCGYKYSDRDIIMKKTVIGIFITIATMLCVACENRNTDNDIVSEKDSIVQDEPGDTDTTEEISYDDDGLPFVKNQILIYSEYGTDKKEVEALIDDIGGETLEYMDDMYIWLVEMEGEHTYEELEELIERLRQNPIVSDADLNYIGGEAQPD